MVAKKTAHLNGMDFRFHDFRLQSAYCWVPWAKIDLRKKKIIPLKGIRFYQIAESENLKLKIVCITWKASRIREQNSRTKIFFILSFPSPILKKYLENLKESHSEGYTSCLVIKLENIREFHAFKVTNGREIIKCRWIKLWRIPFRKKLLLIRLKI